MHAPAQGWFGGGGGGRAPTKPPTAGAQLPRAAAQRVWAGKPQLLIGFNEATKAWELNGDAAAALGGVAAPLVTVVVCGRARQGKSFL